MALNEGAMGGIVGWRRKLVLLRLRTETVCFAFAIEPGHDSVAGGRSLAADLFAEH